MNSRSTHHSFLVLYVTRGYNITIQVDANLSGTTAISVSFHGHSITVCNVGDSRAILGHCTNDHKGGGETKTERLVAIPLSRDHTPYRKDERERVRQAGAAVMSIGTFLEKKKKRRA